jgi:molybdate transport system substrate-binding protein
MTNAIRVLSTIGMRTVLEEIAPPFERAHGCTVVRVYHSSVTLLRRIAEGEAGDAAVFTSAAIDDLIAQGKVASRTDLTRSGVGIAVRKGAPKPDIATAEAFRTALLAARSIAHSKTGASGIYFASLIERLGIADAIRRKAIVEDGVVAEIAARGEAEIAVQQISELMQSSGVDIVGPLPPELQSITVFSAGVFKSSSQPALAEAFVAHLASPTNAGLIRAKGMEPV